MGGYTSGSFKKGNQAWKHPNCKKTRFKKGQTPHNKKPEGYKYIDTKGYFMIKHNNKFIKNCKYIWEQKNGKIICGLVIHHKNMIKTDDRIENLQILSRADHATLHIKHRNIK